MITLERQSVLSSEISAVNSQEGVFLALKRVTHEFSLRHVTLLSVNNPDEKFLARMVVESTVPESYFAEFDRKRLLDKCSVEPIIVHSKLPFCWSINDTIQTRGFDIDPAIEELQRRYDLLTSVAMTLFSRDGERFIMRFDGTRPRLTQVEMNELGMITLHAFDMLDKIRHVARKSAPAPLTARELEVVRWTAQGKTSAEIGRILALSDHTVNAYMTNAIKKLDCDTLGLSSAVVDTTYAAISSSLDVMSEIKSKLVTAHEESADKTQINLDLTKLKEQLRATLEAASFSGENWLVWNSGKDSLDKEIPNSFIRNSDGTVAIGKMTYTINTPPPRSDTNVQYFVDNGGSGEYGILSSEAFAVEAGAAKNYVLLKGDTAPASAVDLAIDASTTPDDLDGMLNTVESMTKQMTIVGATMGAITQQIDLQLDFASKLSDSIDEGVSRLVDADMESASARLQALQTQQQLALNALTISNSTPENLLPLFQ
eukprot:g7676.t1